MIVLAAQVESGALDSLQYEEVDPAETANLQLVDYPALTAEQINDGKDQYLRVPVPPHRSGAHMTERDGMRATGCGCHPCSRFTLRCAVTVLAQIHTSEVSLDGDLHSDCGAHEDSDSHEPQEAMRRAQGAPVQRSIVQCSAVQRSLRCAPSMCASTGADTVRIPLASLLL